MRSPIANTITLRGAHVDFRVVGGGFNQLRSPVPETKGTMSNNAVVQYPGTSTIATRGGYQIWPKGSGVSKGYDIKVEVDANGGTHLFAPRSVEIKERMPLPHDNIVASFTRLDTPAAPTPVRERELVLG